MEPIRAKSITNIILIVAAIVMSIVEVFIIWFAADANLLTVAIIKVRVSIAHQDLVEVATPWLVSLIRNNFLEHLSSIHIIKMEPSYLFVLSY